MAPGFVRTWLHRSAPGLNLRAVPTGPWLAIPLVMVVSAYWLGRCTQARVADGQTESNRSLHEPSVCYGEDRS